MTELKQVLNPRIGKFSDQALNQPLKPNQSPKTERGIFSSIHNKCNIKFSKDIETKVIACLQENNTKQLDKMLDKSKVKMEALNDLTIKLIKTKDFDNAEKLSEFTRRPMIVLAAEQKNSDAVKLLLEQSYAMTAGNSAAVVAAIKNKDLAMLDLFVQEGFDLNYEFPGSIIIKNPKDKYKNFSVSSFDQNARPLNIAILCQKATGDAGDLIEFLLNNKVEMTDSIKKHLFEHGDLDLIKDFHNRGLINVEDMRFAIDSSRLDVLRYFNNGTDLFNGLEVQGTKFDNVGDSEKDFHQIFYKIINEGSLDDLKILLKLKENFSSTSNRSYNSLVGSNFRDQTLVYSPVALALSQNKFDLALDLMDYGLHSGFRHHDILLTTLISKLNDSDEQLLERFLDRLDDETKASAIKELETIYEESKGKSDNWSVNIRFDMRNLDHKGSISIPIEKPQVHFTNKQLGLLKQRLDAYKS